MRRPHVQTRIIQPSPSLKPLYKQNKDSGLLSHPGTRVAHSPRSYESHGFVVFMSEMVWRAPIFCAGQEYCRPSTRHGCACRLRASSGKCAMHKLGIQVLPSPDMIVIMDAIDTLHQVTMLSIRSEGMLAYYTADEFAAVLRKWPAFQLRGIKQIRGSSCEGIWITKRHLAILNTG